MRTSIMCIRYHGRATVTTAIWTETIEMCGGTCEREHAHTLSVLWLNTKPQLIMIASSHFQFCDHDVSAASLLLSCTLKAILHLYVVLPRFTIVLYALDHLSSKHINWKLIMCDVEWTNWPIDNRQYPLAGFLWFSFDIFTFCFFLGFPMKL